MSTSLIHANVRVNTAITGIRKQALDVSKDSVFAKELNMVLDSSPLWAFAKINAVREG
jgi:hypothetical protein